MDELKKIKTQLYELKKKSNRRKRQLKSMNERIKIYSSLADAAISDAARYRVEVELWKERYERLLSELQTRS